MKWAYGVLAVPERADNLLPATLASLATAGFPTPRLFVDGLQGSLGQYHVTSRWPRVGAMANWALALVELLHREPRADRYALFQDDVAFVKGLRQHLERSTTQASSYWNCYTMPVNEKLANGRRGWYPSDGCGRGALALVFSRDTVLALLSARSFVCKPLAVEKPNRNIDGCVVEALRGTVQELVHYPSLCQHTGKDKSIMGSPQHPLSESFPGEAADASSW